MSKKLYRIHSKAISEFKCFPQEQIIFAWVGDKVFSHKYRLKAAYDHVVRQILKAFPKEKVKREEDDTFVLPEPIHFKFTASKMSDLSTALDRRWSRKGNNYLGWCRTAFIEWEGEKNATS